MSDKSTEWDRKYGNRVDHHKIVEGKFIPVNRPCDWCGRTVKLGYIHEKCMEEERKKIIDAVY